MPKRVYVEKKFGAKSLAVIQQADAICREYAARGFTLTLRQLYYQFVSRDLIPNKQSEYKRLGEIVNDARLAGLLDWNWLEDRTRNLRTEPSWNDPNSIIHAAANSYHLNRWKDQPYYPEVWIEKDALIGVIEPICSALDVPYFSCRGFGSQSEMWRAAQRHINARYQRTPQREFRQPIIFHLGDHDPSGIDMSRDIEARLLLFEAPTEVRRIALNMNQVEQYAPPPNPAKTTDSRYEGYLSRYGEESWELDALNPDVIAALIRSHVEPLIVQDRWEAVAAREAREREALQKAADNWSEVEDYLLSTLEEQGDE